MPSKPASICTQDDSDLLSRDDVCPNSYWTYLDRPSHRFITAPKDTVPPEMQALFALSCQPPPPFLDFERAVVHSEAHGFYSGELTGNGVADVTPNFVCLFHDSERVAVIEWMHTGFGIYLQAPKPPQRLPFTEHDLLEAVLVAKGMIETFCLPPFCPESSSSRSSSSQPLAIEEASGDVDAACLDELGQHKRLREHDVLSHGLDMQPANKLLRLDRILADASSPYASSASLTESP